MERVLIVGSGAREHAIAGALARSVQRPELVCFSSAVNPGIEALCATYGLGSITDPAAVAAFALEQRVTMAVLGPEAPLAAGVADALWAAGVGVVGPTQSLARVESSKAFTRGLLAKYGIAGNPFFRRFTSMEGVAETLAQWPGRHVIKDDGLAGGKGVKVCGDHLLSMEESLAFCAELVALGHPFVVEEKLEGEEFSLLSFCDGRTLRHMPAVQDHKRAFVGDTGPNTGGMGTYSAADHGLPFLEATDIAAAQAVNERVVAALAEECGAPYKGVLYGGFMATRDGVKLIEYNARFGDPECLNLLTLLETDFVAVCRAMVDGTLDALPVTFSKRASVCKYVVPEGYPDAPRKGDAVVLPDELPPDAVLFLSAVDVKDGRLVATGSRTVAVVATGETISEAEVVCECVVRGIPGPFFHREDIGTEAALARRVEHMRAVREKQIPSGNGRKKSKSNSKDECGGLRVAVLGSTRGTALQGVLDALAAGTLPGVELVVVVADKPAAWILERAKSAGIATLCLDAKGEAMKGLSREEYDARVTEALREAGAELVLMIGYMRIVSAEFVEAWKGRMLNVHPSLLPAFGGLMNRSVHEAVLAAGVCETGCTIHLVTEEVDGGPIVLQKRCAVLAGDTVDTLKDRVQALEQEAFVEVLRQWRRDGEG
jgi:formyltetrahydrofolate-dependent phosphoribosylglycinamide formyltransferase